MITGNRTCVRTCIRTSDRNQPVTMCQFVSMFSKARCALRKLLSFNELRLGRHYQLSARGHKKSHSFAAGLRTKPGVGCVQSILESNCENCTNSSRFSERSKDYVRSDCRDSCAGGRAN